MRCKHEVIIPIDISPKLSILKCVICGVEVGRIESSHNIVVAKLEADPEEEAEIARILYPDRKVEGKPRPLTKKEREALK